LPVQGYQPLSDGLLASLRSLLLPSIALSILYGALLARVTRAAMLDVLGSDYIRAARARGFSLWRVMVNHALRNAGLPVVTVIGLGFATLLGGVVVTESVFNIPGVGRLVVEAVLRRDYPVVQGALLVFSAAMIAANLLVDLAYGLIDPRVRG
jgi:peptide/nickel transport system permease protein